MTTAWHELTHTQANIVAIMLAQKAQCKPSYMFRLLELAQPEIDWDEDGKSFQIAEESKDVCRVIFRQYLLAPEAPAT